MGLFCRGEVTETFFLENSDVLNLPLISFLPLFSLYSGLYCVIGLDSCDLINSKLYRRKFSKFT